MPVIRCTEDDDESAQIDAERANADVAANLREGKPNNTYVTSNQYGLLFTASHLTESQVRHLMKIIRDWQK